MCVADAWSCACLYLYKCLTCYMFACCKHVALPARLVGAGVLVYYLLAKPCVSILLFPPTTTLQNVGGVGMFDSALAFFEEGSLLVWAVRRSRVSLAFGIA